MWKNAALFRRRCCNFSSRSVRPGEIDQNSRFRNLHPKWSNLDPIALVNFSNENKIEANQEQRCRLNNKIVKKLTQGKLL